VGVGDCKCVCVWVGGWGGGGRVTWGVVRCSACLNVVVEGGVM
jgi:hypothetical protein